MTLICSVAGVPRLKQESHTEFSMRGSVGNPCRGGGRSVKERGWPTSRRIFVVAVLVLYAEQST